MTKAKILIILSDAASFDLRKKDGNIVEEETGFFLMELAKPLAAILEAGYDVEFASPNGENPNIDPLSNSLVAFMGNFWEKQREEQLIERMKVEKNLGAPRAFRDITDEELNGAFKGIFIPGGHAPLVDLGADPELGRILLHFHSQHKPTAVICHGPYAFLSTSVAPNSDGFAYKGYKITSWSDAEEKLVETLKGGEIEKVESSLRQAGADMQTGTAKMMGDITVDREVVSGANPMAAAALASKFVEMLGA